MEIVDDHAVIIVGTINVLRADPNLEVASAATTVQQLLAREARLDVVLLDLQLNDSSTPTENIRILSGHGIPAHRDQWGWLIDSLRYVCR